MQSELITVEDAGPSQFGGFHEIRAFWRIIADDSNTKMKRKAGALARKIAKEQGYKSAKFSSWDLDTYSSPQMAAILRYRLIPHDDKK